MASQETFDPINPFHLDSGLDSKSKLNPEQYAKKFNKMIYDHFVIEGARKPIPGIYFVSDNSKNFAKKIYGSSSPKLITVSRLDRRKSHQNVLMTIKNLLPKFPNLK